MICLHLWKRLCVLFILVCDKYIMFHVKHLFFLLILFDCVVTIIFTFLKKLKLICFDNASVKIIFAICCMDGKTRFLGLLSCFQ